jgi:hypothetical protein
MKETSMNPRTLVATAIVLAVTATSTAAVSADLPDQAAPAATNARVAPEQPDRGQPQRSVVAPPKPQVETIVQPGLKKIDKHERVSDVLKARQRAGGTGRVVSE